MVAWMLGIGVSLAALILSAAMWRTNPSMAYAHLAISAAVSILFALLAIRETRSAIEAGASKSAVASSTARFMGLVWSWAALGIIATYGTGVLAWKEWWHFFIGFFVIAGLCLFLSATLKKDADAGRDDPTMLKIGRYLSLVQLIGMVITIVGLLIDGKMTRFLVPRYTDWAGQNFFFFGAVALAAISGFALKASSERDRP